MTDRLPDEFDAVDVENVEIEIVGFDEDASIPVLPGHWRAEGRKTGVRDALRAILPALDSLETCYREAPDRESLEQGVRVALREIWDVFRPYGLERIEGEHVAFDPHVHEALDVTPTDRVPPNTVLQVLRVGYMLGGELVRPALVRVSGPARAGRRGGQR
ncbi:MAG: nucleotide exchange factor GrpE [Acidobacteria bacterium]|nr:nucleotide exchange factor GrpE [Acidobacteriota bacterium]